MTTLRAFCSGEGFKPDKGYAWFILFLSFVSHTLHIGFSLAIVGNRTIAHQGFFNIDLQRSGLISTVHISITFLFGPVASLLVKKFGCRPTAIFGGLCLVLGFGVSSLSTELWHAFILYGVLAGIGIPSLLVSMSEIISLHFEKYKYLAFALVILGQFCGMAAWPSFSQWLLNEYGYAKAMGIMGSFHITHIIAGIFLIEPSRTNSGHFEATKISDGNTTHQLEDADEIEVEQKLVDDEVTAENAAHDSNNSENGATEQTIGVFNQILTVLKTPQVYPLLITSLLWCANENSFLVFVNDFIVHKTGSSEEEVALGITIIGVANILAAVGVVLTSPLSYDRGILHTASLVVFGLSTIVTAFCTSKEMFYAVCAAWGLGEGACIANHLAFLSGFVETDQLAILFGLGLMVEGISVIISSPLIGYIQENVGPEYGMIVAGCCGIAGALCILPLVVRRICNRRRNTAEDE